MAFTSGTTGKPKAAVHTHRDVLAACEAWPRHVLRATPEDIVVGSPPLAFTFGLGGLLIFPMWAGASVYFPRRRTRPRSLVRTIHEIGATICYTAPTFYRQMAPFARQQGVGKLRISVSAGEGLPDATRQLWKQATGLEMLDGIGATEMFHIFISSAGDEVRRGAIGKVVPGYIAQVVDDEGQEVPRGTIGKLAVIGPTGCKYLDDPRQANYVKDGWNYPGDAFMQDDDGYFFYQARADDMIITAGYNVGGPEVEDALLKHPAVAECGVIGKPDEERGMIVKAFCVLKPGHAGDARHGEGAAGPREGHHRALQVPARDRVRGAPAAHRDRQAAALQVAADVGEPCQPGCDPRVAAGATQKAQKGPAPSGEPLAFHSDPHRASEEERQAPVEFARATEFSRDMPARRPRAQRVHALHDEIHRLAAAVGGRDHSREIQRRQRAVEAAGTLGQRRIAEEERVRSAVDEAGEGRALVRRREGPLATDGEDVDRARLVVGLRADSEDQRAGHRRRAPGRHAPAARSPRRCCRWQKRPRDSPPARRSAPSRAGRPTAEQA